MFHPSQQPREPTQLACLSLAKFSHTTTSIGHNGPLNWSHIIGNGDIVGQIESHSASGLTPARVLLKVFRDYELLEEVDLTYHTREAANFALSGQNSQMKPTFAVIVKLPCLAVKYPKDGICIRRFQIKFSSDHDYYTALAILSNIKCPFSESNVGSLPPARRPTSTKWRAGSVNSAPAPPEMFPSAPSAAGVPTLNNVFIPPRSSSTVDPPAMASAMGSFLRPTSSSTTHTLTELVPTSNSQGPNPNNINLTRSQLQSNIPEQSNAVPSSRPPTACHDTETLDQLLPPKRDLPFTKPATKKPRTSGKQTNNASKSSEPDTERTQTSILDHYDPKPFKATNSTINTNGLKRSLTSLPQLSTNEPVKHPPPSQQNTQATTNIPIPIQPAHPTSTPQQEAPYINAASRPPNKTDISRTAIPMNTNPPQPQPQPQQQQQQQQESDPIADLASYISEPKTERIARLETWICSQIQNDDFLTLTQDVEGLWQRFAFGQR